MKSLMLKGFNSDKWWEQKNPAYLEACKKQHQRDLIELKGQYDYFIKQTNK